MKRMDRIAGILTLVLGILYIPLSLFSFLMLMALESTIGLTNQLYIILIDVFCGVSFAIPGLCVAGTVLAFIFRKKPILAIIFSVCPLCVFVLNILFLALTDLFKI